MTACAALLVSMARPVLAVDFDLRVMAADSAAISFSVNLEGRATEKITRSLRDGFPVQVTYQIELWQVRARWFDRLVAADRFGYLIRLDPWSGDYTLESDDLPGRSFDSEDDLVAWLSDHGPLDITSRDPLLETHQFYLAGHAAIAPLTEEQVGAVERWLRGPSDDGPGMTGVFFDLALRMSGLGALEASAQSVKFRPGAVAR